MIGGTLLAGLIAIAVDLIVAYYVAVVTSRFGLDPDNHVGADHHERHGPGRAWSLSSSFCQYSG